MSVTYTKIGNLMGVLGGIDLVFEGTEKTKLIDIDLSTIQGVQKEILNNRFIPIVLAISKSGADIGGIVSYAADYNVNTKTLTFGISVSQGPGEGNSTTMSAVILLFHPHSIIR